MEQSQLLSVQVGSPKTLDYMGAPDSQERVWTTSFFKEPVEGRVWVGATNVVGDQQANTKSHGGPDKAVCVYPIEHYAYWQSELSLLELPFGAFAENFTTRGQLEEQVRIGDVFQCGEAIVQVSQPRPPCWKLSRRWRVHDFAVRMEQAGLTGWYLRVLQEGYTEAGAQIELLERPHPEWPVAVANDIFFRRRDDAGAAQALAACPALSLNWRENLAKRK